MGREPHQESRLVGQPRPAISGGQSSQPDIQALDPIPQQGNRAVLLGKKLALPGGSGPKGRFSTLFCGGHLGRQRALDGGRPLIWRRFNGGEPTLQGSQPVHGVLVLGPTVPPAQVGPRSRCQQEQDDDKASQSIGAAHACLAGFDGSFGNDRRRRVHGRDLIGFPGGLCCLNGHIFTLLQLGGLFVLL